MWKTRLATIISAVIVMIGLTVTSSTAAAATTGDYHYMCQIPGQSAWTMPEGTEMRMCPDGYIEVRINGELVEVIPTNAEGMRVTGEVPKEAASCIIAVAGTVVGVLTAAGGLGWFGVGLGVAGIAFCKT